MLYTGGSCEVMMAVDDVCYIQKHLPKAGG